MVAYDYCNRLLCAGRLLARKLAYGDALTKPILCPAHDVVILDLWLEHQQAGSMVLGLLMTDPATQHIPMIICSAYRQFLGYQEAQLQAQGYVLLDKPYRVDTLLRAMARLLHGDQARAVGAP